ncbi:hypothetical protein VP1G_09547 [Cytospora mali]|uniref:Alternative oxidase n=1 Tax=Cytospora mali TaxID=578113 RepID=A0A194VEJ0_CYTMA|nr:hypothetical protein VP1G_09547 [Valsa mali var. pyri (nom. inval.)]
MLNFSRGAVFAVVALVLIWGFHLGAYLDPTTPGERKSYFYYKSVTKSPLSPHVHTYFDQVFSAEKPPNYAFSALKAACTRAEWKEENRNVYLECEGIQAGMTSIMSEVKVCFKMAIDAGVNMLLPSMPLRDSVNLKNFNFMNESAYMTYDQWFDQDHLLASMARACPQMKIKHPIEAGTASLPITNKWSMDIGTAPGFRMLSGYFWVGRPFKAWFDNELVRLRFLASANRKIPADDETTQITQPTPEEGASIISIASQFLLFRLTDDPTGREVALWKDLSHLIRFKEEPRIITNRILSHIDRQFFGVHFRVEKDNMWSSFENQLKVDLDALDQAWAQYGSPGKERPLIYLACGDEGQIERFAEAGAQRGWTVTSKYGIAKDYPATLRMIKELPFDFQGAVDMGVMLESHFFMGITGSALSSTVGNMRDPTGRYRGSSLLYPDDGNARTHLFNDGDASGYPCCL